MKLHFSSESYDYIKFNGKVKSATVKSYEKRKDKWRFERIAARHGDHIVDYYVAQAVDDNLSWVGNFSEESYTKYRKRKESQMRSFAVDLQLFLDGQSVPPNELLTFHNGHPPLLRWLLAERIQPDTVIIMNGILQFLSHWKKNSDVVSDNALFRLYKFEPFVEYDVVKARKTIQDKFSTYNNTHT